MNSIDVRNTNHNNNKCSLLISRKLLKQILKNVRPTTVWICLECILLYWKQSRQKLHYQYNNNHWIMHWRHDAPARFVTLLESLDSLEIREECSCRYFKMILTELYSLAEQLVQDAKIISSSQKRNLSRDFLHCSNYFFLYMWWENMKLISFEHTIEFSVQDACFLPLCVEMVISFRPEWNEHFIPAIRYSISFVCPVDGWADSSCLEIQV